MLAAFTSNANYSEDCTYSANRNWDGTHSITGLYANVFRPTGVTEQSKLPVVVVSPRVIQDDAPITSS